MYVIVSIGTHSLSLSRSPEAEETAFGLLSVGEVWELNRIEGQIKEYRFARNGRKVGREVDQLALQNLRIQIEAVQILQN